MSTKQELSPESLADVLQISSLQLSRSADKVVYATSPSTRAGDHSVSQIHLAAPSQEYSSKPLTSGLFNDTSPRFSPKGGSPTIAFISDRAKQGESSAIYLVSATGPGEPYPITPTGNKEAINKIEWSPCGQFIGFVSSDEKTPEQERKEEEKDDGKVFGEDWPYQRLRIVHVATKEVKTLIRGERHVSDFVWMGNGKGLIYLTNKTPEVDSGIQHGTDFATVNLTTGVIKEVCTFPGLIYSRLVEKDDAVYFIAGTKQRSICTSTTVYRIDLTAGTAKYEQHVEQGKWCYSAIQGGGSNVVSVVVQRGLESDVMILDGDTTSTVYSGLHEIEAWTEAWTVAATEEGPTVALVKSDINTPAELYSLSPTSSTDSTPKPIRLSSHHESLLPSPIATFTPIYTTSSDGTLIDGILTIPKSTSSSPIPLILSIHGGPYFRFTATFSESNRYWTPHLVSAGYAVLRANYRGGSGHGEEYAAAARGGMGGKEYGDVMTLLRHVLKEHDELDKGKVAVYGWSQGGFLSYLSTVRGVKVAAQEALRNHSVDDGEDEEYEEQPDRPFHFRAAICGAGVTDWDMITMSSDAPFFESELAGSAPWTSDKSSLKTRDGSAIWEMKEAAKTVDAALAAVASKSGQNKTKGKTLEKEQMMTPVLILHGESDERVPVTQAVAFRRGAQCFGWPCEMVVYPRESHDVLERGHVIDMLKRVRRFLDGQLR